MKGRIRQCSPSTWQISYSLPHDVLEKHRVKAQTIRDRLAQWMRGVLPAEHPHRASPGVGQPAGQHTPIGAGRRYSSKLHSAV